MQNRFHRPKSTQADRLTPHPKLAKDFDPELAETQPSGMEKHAVVGVPEDTGGYLTVLFEYFGKVVTITEPGLLRDFVDGKIRAM